MSSRPSTRRQHDVEQARFRCDPCGFASGVLVSGRESTEVGVLGRASLALVPCPRCGRRDSAGIAWVATLASLVAACLGGAASLLLLHEHRGLQALGVLAAACAFASVATAVHRYLGARRAIAFKKW